MTSKLNLIHDRINSIIDEHLSGVAKNEMIVLLNELCEEYAKMINEAKRTKRKKGEEK
jgi:hypothetical protein